ncbi:DoxX family protein [Paenarthrobacter sp. DKR-5]|uniref:DoxX family protein n=1 Tax=Paenarthrobacter sp. DKR-5 TaxID=2835535 RepID=UPI001BDDB3B5|nr:DoxX family protein [Paenarthrobacter sp. DKR-5]MBT1003079.1 DoxX family protein [Paenarthrobacter sp. DKR-5]
MTVIRSLARPMLASSFIVAGADRLRKADETVAQLSPVLRRAADALPFPTNEKMLARVIGGTQIGAGALLSIGKFSRLSSCLLALTSALNTFVEYRSADITTKEGREHRRNQLLKNVALTGGVLLAAVDTAGRPGLAWRAEHLAADARRSSKKLTADARRSSKKNLKRADKAVRGAASSVTGA